MNEGRVERNGSGHRRSLIVRDVGSIKKKGEIIE